MITIFNRKELISTFDLKTQADVREVLSCNHIDYTYKVINRKSVSPVWAGTRAYTGTLGEKTEMENEYTFFVNRNDYERASALIRMYYIH